MIPLRTVLPTRTFPAATVALAMLLVAVFASALCVDAPPAAAVTTDVMGGAFIRFVRLAAASLVHEDGPRIAANVWCLWLFGEGLEDRMGGTRFLGFYAACVVAGAGIVLAVGPAPVPTGATAAVAGVIGAHLSLYPGSRVLVWLPLPAERALIEVSSLSIVAFWAAIHLAASLAPSTLDTAIGPAGIAAASGVVTAMAGALLVRAFTRRERMRPEWWHDRDGKE